MAPHCMNVAITFNIADILEEQPEGMHITQLGQRAGIDPGKLGRILRLLATRHIFREGQYSCQSTCGFYTCDATGY